MHPGNDEERTEALARAGRAPSLFKRIRDAFPEEPSERTITSFLIREGFTDSAIPSVLKSYRETNRFLAAEGVADSPGHDGDFDSESFSDEEEDDDTVIHSETKAAPTPPPAQSVPAPPSPVQSGLSVNFDMKSVTISGHTTSPTELREFIKALTGIADLFDMLTTPIKDLPPPPQDLTVADS